VGYAGATHGASVLGFVSESDEPIDPRLAAWYLCRAHRAVWPRIGLGQGGEAVGGGYFCSAQV